MPSSPPSPRSRQIELVLQQIDELPTLSPVASRLLDIASIEDVELDPLVELIECDPALSAKVLALCQRADRGLGSRISTVRRAVVMLGLNAVQAAVLAVCVYDIMASRTPTIDEPTHDAPSEPPSIVRTAEASFLGPTIDAPSALFDRPGFWKHAVATAAAAELIAEAHPRRGVLPEEAFVAGLLHDLGKLALDLVLPRAYARVLGLAERRATTAADAERQLLGIDHHTAAKRLAEHWGLPESLAHVMWLHSHPAAAIADLPHCPLIGIVSTAKALCRGLHLGWSGDFDPAPPLDSDRGLCRQFGLDLARVEKVVPRLHAAVAERLATLGLGGADAHPQLLWDSIAAANRRLSRLTGVLEQRARHARSQARALQAIADFHADHNPGRTVPEALARIVRSASSILGRGFYAALFQPRPGAPCLVLRFDADGRPTRSREVDAPIGPPHRQNSSLASLADPAAKPLSALALAPWLADELLDAPDSSRLRVLPLITPRHDDRLTLPEGGRGGELLFSPSPREGAGGRVPRQSPNAEGRRSGSDARPDRRSRGDFPAAPTAVLLHDRPIPPSWSTARPDTAALFATWAAAVADAAGCETTGRLTERLADTNRALVHTQQKLAETQSLARLGQMAAGAAHEMNNPLAVISGRSQMLAQSLTDPADRAAAAAVADAAQHLSDLITGLKFLADPPRPAFGSTPADELCRAAIERAEERTGLRGRVHLHAPDPAPVLHADRELLKIALAELVANALEAAPDSAVTITVRTDPADDHADIAVHDDGPGLSPRATAHAFDPFFSDKPAGRRTGLGLTRARRLVELHRGEISLRSSPGRGTTATVSIPRHAPVPIESDADRLRAA